MDEFIKKLDQVKDGEIEYFELDPKDFDDFYLAWKDYPYQSLIKGVAQKMGKVRYILR